VERKGGIVTVKAGNARPRNTKERESPSRYDARSCGVERNSRAEGQKGTTYHRNRELSYGRYTRSVPPGPARSSKRGQGRFGQGRAGTVTLAPGQRIARVRIPIEANCSSPDPSPRPWPNVVAAARRRLSFFRRGPALLAPMGQGGIGLDEAAPKRSSSSPARRRCSRRVSSSAARYPGGDRPRDAAPPGASAPRPAPHRRAWPCPRRKAACPRAAPRHGS